MGLMTRVASIAALLGLIPDDAEGMYVGPRARGWDDLPGKFSSLIDRKVRAEISDEDASLKAGDNAAQSLKRLFARKQNRRLEEILDHPELYRQYPELKDLTVYHDPRYAATEVGGPQASTSPTGSINFHKPLFIEMGVARRQQGQGADKDYGTSVLLHELQHKIQGKEGWAAGGNPNMVITTSALKRGISAFDGNNKLTTNVDASDKKIIMSVDYYESDFGIVKVYISRFLAYDDGADYHSVLFLEKEKWQLGTLIPLKVEKLAKTGLGQKIQISTEYTLVCREEKANARIKNCYVGS